MVKTLASLKRPNFSKKQLLTFAIGFGLIGSYLIIRSFAATIYYISPSGSDSNPCSQSSPCQSLSRGLSVASAGDTVAIKSGTYGNQWLMEDKGGTVTLKPDTGATVTFGDIIINTGAGNIAIDGVSMRDLSIGPTSLSQGQKPSGPPAHDIYLSNIDGHIFNIAYASRVRITDSDWGPARNTRPTIAVSNPWDPPEAVPVDILIENNYFHGITMDPDAEHVEGILLYAGNGIVIRNNIFGKDKDGNIDGNGGTGDLGINFLHLDEYNPLIANVIIEGNQAYSPAWAKEGDAYFNMQYDGDIPGLTIRNNSFPKGILNVGYIPPLGISTANPPPNWPPSSSGTPPPPTVSLSANPSSITSGSSSTLSWSSANATSCSASGAWSGAKATSGSQSVSPTSTSTYSLSCSGSGGSASSSATVSVNAAPPPLTINSSINSGDSIRQGTDWVVSFSQTPSKVEFWADGTKLAEDTASPYSTNLNLSTGNHQLGLCTTISGNRVCHGNGGVYAAITVTPSTKPGDLNNDGVVNITDLSILLTNYNSSNAAADLNNDGSVNIFDLSILLTSYGS